MKFATKFLCWMLCMELAMGPAFAQISNTTRVLGTGAGISGSRTEQSGVLDKKQKGSDYIPPDQYLGTLSKEELQIDTMAEADDYIQSTIDQSQWFEEQCAVRKPDGVHIKWDTAFVLHDNIKYADMDIKNCAQEHEKLTHMVNVAKVLAEHNGTEEKLIKNKSCAECSISPTLDNNDNNPDYVPPGDKCSVSVQQKMAAENCGFLNAMGSAVTHWSCLGNLLKGVINGLKDAIVGIGKLLWEGVKAIGRGFAWVGKKIWGFFSKAEDKADENILAVSKKKQEEYEAYQKDKEGWLSRTGNTIMSIIKEITYKGMYERESKCMTCQEKGDLLCEIGGRIFNDVVGFTFTMGVGYGAIKTMAAKLGPKLSEITAKMTARFASAAEKGGLLNKTRNVAWNVAKGTVKKVVWVGSLPIKAVIKVSQKTAQSWRWFKNKSWAYKALFNPANPKSAISFLKKADKALGKVPSTILIKPVRWTGKQLDHFNNWQNRIMAKGAYRSADVAERFGWAEKGEALKLRNEMLPHLDKDDVVLENSNTRSPSFNYSKVRGVRSTNDDAFKGMLVESVDSNEGQIVARMEIRDSSKGLKGAYNRVTQTQGTPLGAKSKWRVWEVPPSYLEQNADKVAEYRRAGFEFAQPGADGRYVTNERGMIEVATPSDNFKKYYRGKYETPKRVVTVKDKETKEKTVYEIPMNKKGEVIIKYDDQVITRKAKDISKEDLVKYKQNHAVFTTSEHPDANRVINPNKIDSKLISTNIQDPGKIVAVRDGKVWVFDARDVKQNAIAEGEKQGFHFIEGGTDNPEAISEWTKDNKLVKADDMDVEVKKTWEARIMGNTEFSTANPLKDVENLEVAIPPPVEQAVKAQSKLSGVAKIHLEDLKGMEGSYDVAFASRNLPGQTPHIEINFLNETSKKLPYTRDAGNLPTSVRVYNNETRAIVTNSKGDSVIYDISKGELGKPIKKLDAKTENLVEEAMGLTVNGESISTAKLKEVRENLLAQGKVEGEYKDFYFVEKDGKRSMRINLPKECNPRFVDIPITGL